MDYMEDFQELLNQAMANMENDIYNNLLKKACCDDGKAMKAGLAFIRAMNRRGVSSKVMFDAMLEVAKETKKDE